MARRYELRAEKVDGTFQVADRFTGQPVHYEGVPQTGLDHDDAEELADLLNYLDERRRAKGLPEWGPLKR
jgi:hypothetical protein